MKKSLLVITILVGLALFLTNYTSKLGAARSFHTDEELQAFKSQTPIGPGDYFLTSESCKGCHGYDSLQQANIDENGNDVNLFDRWEGTMMANAARDPFWRAKVSHEILINPAHSSELQTKCTSCHAPMGHYDAFFNGATEYTLADLAIDSLGKDGVSCAGCHTIGYDAGNTFSGDIPYDTSRTIFGPFMGPFAGPMQLYEGYTPAYSPHMSSSTVCSSCHTLFTQSVDLTGTYTGGEFIEQATYHEYLNSSFPANNIQCQTCHMPQITDEIVIANGYINLQGRTPFNQHTFAGANTFMINLIKNNKASLGITTPDFKFDTALAATTKLLREGSVEFDVTTDNITTDTAYFKVKIRNKAGHKFPSGYPSRRAVVQFVLTDAAGDTVFQSGIFDNDYRVVGESAQFESHYDVIKQSNVPQIYEIVMGDINADYTSVLERAAIVLKDNRIPPDGFTSTSPVYDTVPVSADANLDPDFNKVNTVEGSGTDYVHYRVALAGVTGVVTAHAKLLYQSVPPKFTDEMFLLNSAEIDTFRNMYLAADHTPFQVAEDSLTEVLSSIGNISDSQQTRVWPSVINDGNLNVSSESFINRIDVYNTRGRKVDSIILSENTKYLRLKITGKSGAYFIRVYSQGKIYYHKIIKL